MLILCKKCKMSIPYDSNHVFIHMHGDREKRNMEKNVGNIAFIRTNHTRLQKLEMQTEGCLNIRYVPDFNDLI